MLSRRRQSPLFCKRAIDYENLRIGVLSWPNSTFQLSAGFGLHRFIEIDGITKAVQDKNPLLLVHSAFYFPAVYSILYDPNESLTCIQITTRRKHHILLSGLRLIQSWLERDMRLAGLLPSKERPWRFIFIVPPDQASFDLQPLGGDIAQGEWSGNVQQYVLGLYVFGRDTSTIDFWTCQSVTMIEPAAPIQNRLIQGAHTPF